MSSDRLDICLVTTFYPPHHFGGDAMQSHRLARALADAGHRVTVVHSRTAYRSLGGDAPADGFAVQPGIEVVPVDVPLGRAGLLPGYLAGRPVLESRGLSRVLGRGFDVVHFQNVSLLGGPGVLRRGQARARLYTIHEHWLVCPMHVLWRMDREPCERPTCVRCSLAFRRPPQPWRATAALRSAAKGIDAFLAPSRFTIAAHRARGFAEPITLLPHFLARAEAEAPGDPRLVPDGRPYALFAGRLEALKGVGPLIETFTHYDGLDLLVAGDGSEAAALRRLAAGAPHVRFLGRVDPAALRSLIASATVVVVPSVGYEVFGLVVLEAFAQGTPVVVHDLGALPELVEETGGGWTYRGRAQLVDALDEARSDPAERDRRGSLGRAGWSARYTEEAHLDAYLGIVRGLLR